MAVTEILQILEPFEPDGDDSSYQGGNLGLHLGVLRAFAMLALKPPVHPSRSDVIGATS